MNSDPTERGRSRARTRSRNVSVAELIGRHPGPVRSLLPGSEPGRHEQQHEQQPGTHGRGTVPHPDPPSPPRTLRTAGALLGVLLLCGGMTLTSLILQRSPASSPAVPGARAEPVTGAQALRPDLLHRARPFTVARPPARESGQLRLEDLLGPPPPKAESDVGLGQANPLAGSTRSAILLITNFHRLLGTDPDRAMALVSPELITTQRAEIVRAWQALKSVRTQRIHSRQDGAVVATLTAEHPDGRHIMLRHVFTVDEGTHPYIVDIELLAARHT
ncbi:hypothetical protein [Haloactinomyces albus]|uniref:Uncharacterized protein n=1 Tax=Haloactinomyces albus TaxID=1352928 RepID=A0AAE3ZCV1_9ACTN|nr:hypothetical protein [Haloactinomyces albus]MDR7302571.1 hypothetical protein [Haloactinomyces albus]